ncbi:restriction endonuclease subunit S [Methylobacterium sp. 17Sr1-1]|uniref:restriction endonuclease subunit S n=1 Tax=Methylobacterium sp. 17Sr1-1 TaxID=2202826 RepID=UPI000D703E25|nr:restriction endonuclease subunit S [Methylobacterium sp. 17Sr1-1]AWN55413.1 hypothetical protein DK412_04685 [Methylobacterium sp. 17Sr1-1]
MTLRSPNFEFIQSSTDPLLNCAERWPRVELGKIAEIKSGFAYSSRYFNELSGTPLIRIRDIGKNTAETLYSGPITDDFWVNTGDYLVGLDGEFRSANWNGPRALLNQRVAKITVDSPIYRQSFLELILPGYLKAINANTSSVTVKHLSTRTISSIPLPQPSLSEQDEIITFMKDVDRAIRQADFEASSAAQKISNYFDRHIKNAYNSREGWTEESLGDIASVQGGITLGRKYTPNDDLVELPYLRVANVQRGRLDLKDVKSIMVRKTEVDRLLLEVGDVLMNEGGDRDKLGRGWIWEGQISNCIHQNHVFRVRLNSDIISPLFLARYTNYVAHSYLEAAGTQTSNLASISARAVKSLIVPIPPRDTVTQIDNALTLTISEIENLQREVQQARHLLGAIRPKMLGEALSGDRSIPSDVPIQPISVRVKSQRSRTVRQINSGSLNAMHSKQRPSLASILITAEKPLSPEQLFTASHYDIEDLENFYSELSALIDAGTVFEDSEKNLIGRVTGKLS